MHEKAVSIKALIVDVDGILTDGTIGYGNFNDTYRYFHVHDGMGYVLLHKAGLLSAIISSKASRALKRRAKEMRIGTVCSGIAHKSRALTKILKRWRLSPGQVCYMGDDLLDLAVLESVGFAATVPSACEEVKACVDYVTVRPAGHGAVREVIELILKAQGKWQPVIAPYYIT